jgi:hypothetical protein
MAISEIFFPPNLAKEKDLQSLKIHGEFGKKFGKAMQVL